MIGKCLLDSRGRLALISLCSIGLLLTGLLIQWYWEVVPCPMCIMQRYVFIAIALLAGFTAFLPSKHRGSTLARWLVALLAISGAGVAARQSWLQWYPPATVSCGRDFWGIMDTFSLSQAFPIIFRGSGDCSAVDWTFLGGSIANWSFMWFCGFAVWALLPKPKN